MGLKLNGIIDNLFRIVRKRTPDILVGVGVAGVITGVVVACKETTKVEPVLEDHLVQMDIINNVAEAGQMVDSSTNEIVEYTENDKKRDITITYVKTGYRLIKLYLPAALIIGGSIGCILGSHKIMSKRNAGLTAAYLGLSESFKNYRNNIVEKYGESADIEANYNLKAKKIKGKKGEEDSVEYKSTDKTKEYDHSRFFDELSRYWDKDINTNLMVLYRTELNMNRKLKNSRSHQVTLNQVLDALDLRPSPDGNVLGWNFTPGKDELDFSHDPAGVPNKIKIVCMRINDTTGLRESVNIDDARLDNKVTEPVILLDFLGLEVL